MNAVESWVLGYLVNALWQGGVLGCAAWLLARTMKRLGPRIEHRIWCVALMAMVVLPAVLVRPVSILWAARDGARGLVTVVTGDGRAAGAVRMPSMLFAIVVGAYAMVLTVMAIRLGWKFWRTVEMVRRTEPFALTGAAAATWQRVCGSMGLNGVLVRISDAVSGPVTVGIWRRVVIFPRGFFEQVSETEVAAAIAHECAHVQRHDFAKNLAYEALLLPLAWHPAAWLARARVAESREIVCDAMAAETMAGRQMYAKALLRLASRMVECPPQRDLHAIGVFDANRLEERVMRLTEKRFEVQGARRLAMAALCGLAGLGTMAAAAELRVSFAVPNALPVPAQSLDGKSAPRVAGGVMAGNILTRVNPVYPQAAKDAKVQGAVLLKAVIGKDGAIKSLQLVSGPDELTQSAWDAVKQWVYKPYLLNGEPTEVETTITVNYTLAK